MNMELKPKYKIGQKISRERHLGKEKISEIKCFVSDINAIYNFKTNKIKYEYELSFEAEGRTYILERTIMD